VSAQQPECEERDRSEHGLDDAAEHDRPLALLSPLAQQGLQSIHYLGAGRFERSRCVLREIALEDREEGLCATHDNRPTIVAHLHDRVLDLIGRQPLDSGLDSSGGCIGSLARRTGPQ